MVELIGAPYDLSGGHIGSRLGPSALRLAGIQVVLEELGMEVVDSGDIPISQDSTIGTGIKYFASAFPASKELKSATLRSLAQNRIPIVLAGDHSLGIGSISAALDHFGAELAVIWIDAHADINTPDESPSGNLHGMPLAALMGFPSGVMGEVDEDWRAILSGIVAERRLSAKQLGFVGLRSVDPGEQRRVASLPEIFITTMQDVDRYGIERVLHGMDDWLRSTGARALWISFDVDVLDPVLAPGTGTTVRGGLSYRESHLCGELLRRMLDEPGCPFKLVGLDLVETNPLIDTNNETAKVVVEWVASLFGKSILGQARSSPL